jgi:hypothetical protein
VRGSATNQIIPVVPRSAASPVRKSNSIVATAVTSLTRVGEVEVVPQAVLPMGCCPMLGEPFDREL